MLYLQKVMKVGKFPKEAMVVGSIKHEVIDGVNRNEDEIVSSIKESFDNDEIEMSYRKRYYSFLMSSIRKRKKDIKELDLDRFELFKRIWPILLQEARTRAANISKFIATSNLYEQELWDSLEPKYKSEVRIIAPNLGLSGIIDKIEVFSDKVVPIEMKSGKMPKDGIWPGHRIQIAAYIMMLKEMRKMESNHGCIDYLDHSERREVIVNPMMEDEVIRLISEVKILLESKEIPHRLNNNKCSNCNLKEECFKALETVQSS